MTLTPPSQRPVDRWTLPPRSTYGRPLGPPAFRFVSSSSYLTHVMSTPGIVNRTIDDQYGDEVTGLQVPTSIVQLSKRDADQL